jgi:hypothetical protein
VWHFERDTGFVVVVLVLVVVERKGVVDSVFEQSAIVVGVNVILVVVVVGLRKRLKHLPNDDPSCPRIHREARREQCRASARVE